MEIEAQVSSEQYLKVIMEFFFKKPIFIFFEIIGILLLGCYILGWNLENTASTPIYYLIFSLFFIFVNPFIFYFYSKIQISKMPEITEKIIYNFGNKNISLTGKNLDSQILWEDIIKIKENSNGFILIQKNKILNFIPKSALNNNYDKFKNLLIEKGFHF